MRFVQTVASVHAQRAQISLPCLAIDATLHDDTDVGFDYIGLNISHPLSYVPSNERR